MLRVAPPCAPVQRADHERRSLPPPLGAARRAKAIGAGSLGNTQVFRPALGDEPEQAASSPASATRARLAFALRPWQRPRVALCRTVRTAPTVQLVGRVSPDGVGRLVVHGVSTCSSVHSCPQCAAPIMTARAQELTQALTTHRRERTALVTFTLRHHAGIPLDVLRTLLARAYSELWAGNGGRALKARLGVQAHVRSAEQTWGENGWHPHLHALVFLSGPVPDELAELLTERWLRCVTQLYGRLVSAAKRAAEVEESPAERMAATRLLGARFARAGKLNEGGKRFAAALSRMGGISGVLPSVEHAVRSERVQNDAAGKYLAKLGLELTGVLQKAGKGEHYTHWQIGQAAAAGQRWAQPLWSEHAAAMLGARQLTWSRGARALLGLAPERPDEQLASEQPVAPGDVDTPLLEIDAEEWDLRARQARQLLIAELHECYQAGDFGSIGRVPWDTTVQRSATAQPDVAPVWWTRNSIELVARERGQQWWTLRTGELARRRRAGISRDPLDRDEMLEELRDYLVFDLGVGTPF